MPDKLTPEKILEKIKQANVKPTPKWEFWLRNLALWLFFVIAIVVGSLATSVVIFTIVHADWASRLPDFSPLKKLLVNIPYVWLAIMLLFVVVAYFNFRQTKKGYRYSAYWVVMASVLISVVLGSVVYAVGGGERLEQLVYERVPFYQQMIKFRARPFVSPEQGLIGGVVVEINSDTVEVIDFTGRTWLIPTTSQNLEVGQRVRISGQQATVQEFEAERIEEWFRPGPRPFGPGKMMPPRF